MVFVHTTASLSSPRPYVPNMIEIGGLHLTNDDLLNPVSDYYKRIQEKYKKIFIP